MQDGGWTCLLTLHLFESLLLIIIDNAGFKTSLRIINNRSCYENIVKAEKVVKRSC